jgi:hypothetical protein
VIDALRSAAVAGSERCAFVPPNTCAASLYVANDATFSDLCRTEKQLPEWLRSTSNRETAGFAEIGRETGDVQGKTRLKDRKRESPLSAN